MLVQAELGFFEEDYNVIVWDAPGHGKSRPREDFSFSNAVEDMKQILDDMGIKKVVMIRQSLGGYYIQSFLQRYPDYTTAFIGIGTTPYGEAYYSKMDKWLLRQIEWMAQLYPFSILREAMARQVATTEYACYAVTI